MTPPDAPTWHEIEVVLCDLDGVVWLAHRPIAGAAAAIERLRATGRRVLFVTNNSAPVVADHEDALATVGISATGDVVTSAQAAASLLDPGERVVVCGGPGVMEAVEHRGAVASSADADPDPATSAVVVGNDRDFTYRRLDVASRAVRHGARFIATNSDATYPTPAGLQPGAGSIVAAVAIAGGVTPVFAGKPEPAMATAILDRVGSTFSAGRTLMVGDRWSTDGAFAQRLGSRFALVRSGVTAPGDKPGGPCDLDQPDLTAVVEVITRS